MSQDVETPKAEQELPGTHREALAFVEELLVDSLEQSVLPGLREAKDAPDADDGLTKAQSDEQRRRLDLVIAAAEVLAKGMRADLAQLRQPQTIVRLPRADARMVLRSIQGGREG